MYGYGFLGMMRRAAVGMQIAFAVLFAVVPLALWFAYEWLVRNAMHTPHPDLTPAQVAQIGGMAQRGGWVLLAASLFGWIWLVATLRHLGVQRNR